MLPACFEVSIALLSAPSYHSMGDGLRRSSALLLKGWKMLSTPCPICSNAIFSKDGAMQCPYCDLPIRVDDGHEEVLQSDNVDQQEDIEDIRSFDDLQQSYENRRKQSDLASAAIGKKLLQGWTMLAEHCPVENCCFAPLMRPEETGPMICPVCECTYELSGDGDVVSTSMPPTKEVSEVEGIAQAPKEKSMESNSAAISSLLLKGWAMLSSTCSCGNNAPLMRDKCGKVLH